MLTPGEFLIRWAQPDTLVRYDPEVVKSLALPEVSKAFLIEAGLPKFVRGSLIFDLPPNNLAPLPEAAARYTFPPKYGQYKFSADYERYRLLGMEIHVFEPGDEYCQRYFCVDGQDNGQVVMVIKLELYQDEFRVSLLNTTVSHFAEMLLMVEEEQRWRRDWKGTEEEEDEVYEHMIEVGALMRLVDPEALQNEGGWHGTIVGYEIGMA